MKSRREMGAAKGGEGTNTSAQGQPVGVGLVLFKPMEIDKRPKIHRI
jgi:hypothetical protein